MIYPQGYANVNWLVELKWPSWYESTQSDRVQQANALAALRTANLISQETAVSDIAQNYNILNVNEEISSIEKDEKEQISMLQPTVTEQFKVV